MKSIRIFLIVSLIATITLVNVLSSVHGYSQSMSEVQKIFDDHLISYSNILSAIPWKLMHDAEKESAGKSINQTLNMGNNSLIAYKVWDDKKLHISSSNLHLFDQNLLRETGFHTINFNGYRWRGLFVYNRTDQINILVAERDDQRFIVSEKVVLESILPIILVLPILSLLIWFIVGVGLAPVTRLAANFRKKQAADLSAIELSGVPKELTLLASSANDLLVRLEQSFDREKRFAADAAHELRTPITALKLHIQNLIAEVPTQSETAALLKQCIDRMGHLIEQILALNSTSTDLYMANFVSLDLVTVTRQIISKQYDKLEKKNISIELKNEPCQLIADQFGIETLLENILGNAIKYTDEKGQIEVQLSKDDSNIHIMIMDSGTGIPLEHRERVFERFYRIAGDGNKSVVTGCGLGLSIVKRIVELHNATIELADSDFTTGLKVSITIPR